MKLNVSKCKVLTVTRKKSPVTHQYYLSNTYTKRVCEKEDLGVIVGVCSSNSLSTRRGTRNLIYILLLFFLIFLQLLLTLLLLYFSYSSLLTSSSIVAVLIAKAGRVWVSWPEEFLLYFLSLTLQQVCYCQRID